MKLKRLLALLLTLAMVFAMVPAVSAAEEVSGLEEYLYYDTATGKIKTDYCTSYNPVTDSTTSLSGWRVVEGTIKIDHAVTVSGSANLLLKDGCELTVDGGIRVESGSSLNIYAQSVGRDTGRLNAYGGAYEAGIGGGRGQNCGTVAIHGGKVNAVSGYTGAGIGGGGPEDSTWRAGNGGTVTIYGGVVNAVGHDGGAGIGGGGGYPPYPYSVGGSGGALRIYGGSVVATADKTGIAVGAGYRGSSHGSVSVDPRVILRDKDGDAVNHVFDQQDWAPYFQEQQSISYTASHGAPLTCGAYDGYSGSYTTETCEDYIFVTKNTYEWTDGWYVVHDSGTFDRPVTVSGNVNLILRDACTLTAAKGIRVGTGSTLSVYAESDGEYMGKLVAVGEANCAGIGSSAGTVAIHGGEIDATGGTNAAGIGGGSKGSGGTLRLYGGKVTAACGENAARAIGAGVGGTDNGTVLTGKYSVLADAEGKRLPRSFGQEWIDVLAGSTAAVTVVPASVTGGTPYLRYNSETRRLEEQTCSAYTIVKSTTTQWTDGWYVLEETGEIPGEVTVTGDVHLILSDGCALTVGHGIFLEEGNSLTVYAQSNGDSRGRLVADGGKDRCGIGNYTQRNGGAVTVHGGEITATGAAYCAGIGGGNNSENSGSFTIYGGSVTAIGGEDAAGIGGSMGGNGAAVAIYGGTVTAQSGREGLRGLGGGYYSTGSGTITVDEGVALIDTAAGSRITKGEGAEWTDVLSDRSVSFTAVPEGPVPYLVYDAESRTYKTEQCEEPRYLGTSETSVSGWKVVTGILSFEDSIRVTGDTHLILCDDCSLTANGGLALEDGASLTIYAQSDGAAMGKLTALGGEENPGIGGSSVGSITIHGGNILARGSGDAAGIGAAVGGTVGAITVSGGTVVANGTQTGPGIGAGIGSECAVITINGGTVTAQSDVFRQGTPGISVGDRGMIMIADWMGVYDDNDERVVPATGETWEQTLTRCSYTIRCESLQYLYSDDALERKTGECTEQFSVLKDTDKVWTAKWYTAAGDVTIEGPVTVTGDVRLLLQNGCHLTVTGGILVESGNSLTVYGQSDEEETMGAMTVTGGEKTAGIGSAEYPLVYDYENEKILSHGTAGTVTIQSGKVTATGGYNGAGIGGGCGCDGGTVVIYGGVVTATGVNAGGLGCGCFDYKPAQTVIPTPVEGGTVRVYGGTVSANGARLHTHTLTAIVQQEATCTEVGYIKTHYVCSGCGKYFSDLRGDTEITSEEAASYVIPALGHSFTTGEYRDNKDGTHSQKCARCDVYGDTADHSYQPDIYLDNHDGATHSQRCALCGALSQPEAHDLTAGPCVCGTVEEERKLVLPFEENGLEAGTSYFYRSDTRVNDHFTVTANTASFDGLDGGSTERRITVEALEPMTTIYSIEAVVSGNGDRYGDVGVSSGKKMETGAVKDGSVVRVIGINDTTFSFEGGTDFSTFKDITVYYTKHVHDFTGEYQINEDGTHAGLCRKGCGQYGERTPHSFTEGVCVCGAAQTVEYQYWEDHELLTARCDTFTSVTDLSVQWEDGRWYVADGELTVSDPITVTGDVHLILRNGCKLQADHGIRVNEDSRLTVYAETEQEGISPGQLIATGDTGAAGIGGYASGETIIDGVEVVLHGGIITATGNLGSTGIGAAGGGSGDKVTIYGGTVNATGGSWGAGLGGGLRGSGDVTVYGGTVNATGGTGAAGLGSGYYGDTCSITVYGGKVTAEGGGNGVGIGAGLSGKMPTVTLYGGDVTAMASDDTLAAFTAAPTLPDPTAFVLLAGTSAETAEEVTEIGKQPYVRLKGAGVVRIGETDYATLEEAIAAAKSGDTITLLRDLTAYGTNTLPTGVSVDCADKKLTVHGTFTGTATGSVYVTANGRYTADGRTYQVPQGETGPFLCDLALLPEWSLNLDSALRMNFYGPAGNYIRMDGEKFEGDSTGFYPAKSYNAKNMVDTDTAALVQSAGTPAVSPTSTVSIQKYAESVLADPKAGTKLVRLMVAMLNYGAEAQKYFGYKTDTLANANVAGIPMPEIPTRSNRQTVTGETALFYGTSCVLGENMNMKLYLKLKGIDGAEAWTYRLYKGESPELLGEGTLGSLTDAGNGYRSYTLTSLVAADIDTPVTLKVFDGDTEKLSVTDSISSYLERVKTSNPECVPVAKAMLQFGVLANDYFRGTDAELLGTDETPVG